jgi:hypothetical protein
MITSYYFKIKAQAKYCLSQSIEITVYFIKLQLILTYFQNNPAFFDDYIDI